MSSFARAIAIISLLAATFVVVVHCNGSGWSDPGAGAGDYDYSDPSVVPPACDPDGLAPCPNDHFVCVEDDAGNKRCEGQNDAVPDGGDWSCEVQGSTLICYGDHLPGEGGDWTCDEVSPGEVICRQHSYVPAGGGDGLWDCWYEENHLVCESGGGGDSDTELKDDSFAEGDGSDGCPPGVETPSAELCDGVDNDCDGSVDEDCGELPPEDGDDTPPGDDDTPPGGDDDVPPVDDVPPGDDEPPVDDEPPPGGGGDEPPPEGCECIPGAVRYCDTPMYCRWGQQVCNPDGMSWTTCVEVAPPAICSVIESWYSPEAEACCIASGFCCQDMWDLDLDGDVMESLGDCVDITCG